MNKTHNWLPLTHFGLIGNQFARFAVHTVLAVGAAAYARLLLLFAGGDGLVPLLLGGWPLPL